MNRILALASASTGISPTLIPGLTAHENQSVQLEWVAVTAEFRDYIILVIIVHTSFDAVSKQLSCMPYAISRLRSAQNMM